MKLGLWFHARRPFLFIFDVGAGPFPYPLSTWEALDHPTSDLRISLSPLEISAVWNSWALIATSRPLRRKSPVHPWRYGGMGGEWGDGFIYVRAIALASRAAFPADDQLIRIGAPVMGFPEPSSGDAA